MTAPGITYPDLKALRPCDDSLRRVARLLGGAKAWNGNPVTAQQARAAGCTFEDIVWAASSVACRTPDVERRLLLWLADCAARVLHIYERDVPGDPRVRAAIIAARCFARGEIGAAAVDAAVDAARAAARAAVGAAAWAAAWAAARAARAAVGAAAWAAAWDAARAARAAVGAAGDAAWGAAWGAVIDAEEARQFDRLVARLSDPEPEDWPLPEITSEGRVAVRGGER
jgi:hypothetical protein